MRYLEIAEALRADIGAGAYGAGGALPSEAALGRRFGVSRVTVRRALDELRTEGIVASRKGSGWFVAVDPVRQALGRFSTVEAALEAAGVEARREVLEFGFGPAPEDVARALDLEAGGEVLRVLRRNTADGGPFGLVTVWVPARLAETISRADVERSTFYELLARQGVGLGAATQTIVAGPATSDDSTHLDVRPGVPMLVCRRLTCDLEGRPVLVSEHRYPAHRTSFEVELPHVGPAGEGPVGLRLVETSDDPAASYDPPRTRRGARNA